MAGTSIETTNRKDFPWFINFDADGSLEGRVETAYRELLDDGKWWTEKSPDGAARLCYQFDKFSQGRVRCWSYAIEYDGRTLGRYRLDGSRLKKDWIITTPGPQASAVIAANKATRVAGASQAAQRSAPPVQQPLTAAKDTQPPVIDVPASAAPLGVRQGQTLNLGDGGALRDQFKAGRGSTVNIAGGTVGEGFKTGFTILECVDQRSALTVESLEGDAQLFLLTTCVLDRVSQVAQYIGQRTRATRSVEHVDFVFLQDAFEFTTILGGFTKSA
ncbi:MAG: hypothetical protein IIC57_01685 [Proteobacteria bacterium]|nr:hypothetical protein [Pseudomonadota bacterium]